MNTSLLTSTSSLTGLNIPLYERVRMDLQARLVSQAWHPNEPIPTEQVLAQEYKVSIGTVRKAVERLVQDGLLAKIQGRGTFIKKPNFSNSLLRFFRYGETAGQQVVPVGSIKSISQVQPDPYINQQLQLDETTSLIQLQRTRSIGDVVILSEKIWLPEPMFRPLLGFQANQFPNLLYPLFYESCGQFVLFADETLCFATDHVDPYLTETKGGFLVSIKRLAYNLESYPIEYRVSYGCPQNFSYKARIS